MLSSAYAWRARVVPAPPIAEEPAPTAMRLARRLDCAALLRRVFGDEVMRCPRCGDSLRVLAFITDLDITAHILEQPGRSDDVEVTHAFAGLVVP